MTDRPWPSELRFNRGERVLNVSFDDGVAFSLPFELLRVESPSAEVQGHGGDQKQIVAGKENIGIAGAEPTGNYAVRLTFDDGHDTGIFTWDYLYQLGSRKDALWQTYLDALEERGLSRSA